MSCLYDRKAWKRKARTQLAHHPLCAYCLQDGLVISAQVADHIVPHKNDAHAFFYGALQSLCKACHDGSKQREEHNGFRLDIGPDGFPIDQRHPFNCAA